MKVILNLPEFNIKTRVSGDKEQVWDSIRMQWLILTPEEWVRQNFIRYMTDYKGVDPLFIKQELNIRLNDTLKRPDIVIYGKDASPKMIIECKAPGVKITKETLEQASRYNMVLGVPFIAVTNGIKHYCFLFDKSLGSAARLDDFPTYGEICKTE